MSLLFGRAWSLDIVPPGKSKGARYSSDESELHLTFEVERTLGSNANKAKIAVTNLTPDNRNNLVQGTTVILRAGYRDNTGIIFQGFIRKMETSQSNADVVTSLDCADGDPFITYGHVHKTYDGNVDLAQILLDLSKTLKVELGGQVYQTSGNIVQGIPNKTFSRYVLHGKTKRELDKLLHPLGMIWSIQCGTLLIQNEKGVINLRAVVVGPDTGMVETPTRTSTGVKCTALLNPSIVPGSAVNIQGSDPATNGNFRCIKCAYKGDTEGAAWTVEIDAQAVIGPLAPVPTTQKTDSFQQGVYEDPDDVEDEVDE